MRGLGGLESRVRAVSDYLTSLPVRTVVVGHDAGALLALALGDVEQVAAVGLLAPLVPGSAPVRALTLEWGSLARVALGRAVPPPRGPGAALAWGQLPVAVRGTVLAQLEPEDGVVVRELALGRHVPRATRAPRLVLSGDLDPILAPAAAGALAMTIGAEHQLVAGAGHWLLAGPAWQAAVGRLHRWLVQRLGEPLLESYAEAMAERDETSGDDD